MTIQVSWRAESLRLEVRNRRNGAAPGPPEGPGHGLLGMRERARAHGGSLEAGAAPDGGFAVTAVLPLRGAP